MLLSVRLRPPAAPSAPGEPGWLDRAEAALSLLSARPGYLRGWVGRSPDDPGVWLLAAQFESAGACRRALSAADVRPVLWPLLADAQDEASTFEVLVAVDAGGAVERLVSDLAPDAAEVGLGRIPAPDAP